MSREAVHRWDVTLTQAAAIQERLRERVVLCPPRRTARWVAGADVAYAKDSDRLYAAVRALDARDLQVVDSATAVGRNPFPYVPGLLSFREAPILLKAFSGLTRGPDVLILDGQGIAHPRGLGLAAHIGLWLDLPTIGCAKSRLCGEHGEVGLHVGDYAPLLLNGKTVGAVLRTRLNVKPVFVSPGHRMDLPTAIRIVLDTGKGYRLPEPTRQAHLLANRLRAGKPG